MIPVSKVVCILACGFILGVAQEYAGAETGNHTNGDAGIRMGGQAGQPYYQMKPQHPSTPAENHLKSVRIGGQAGEPYDQMKPQHPSTSPESHQKSARIGGQAGEEYGLSN